MISELARSSARLTGIECGHWPDEQPDRGCSSLVFHFEASPELIVSVNADSDELVWMTERNPQLRFVDLGEIYPSVKRAYGKHLRWCWEMQNHQGYTDALQIELTDLDLAGEHTLQFRVAASMIEILEVTPSPALKTFRQGG